MNVLQTIGGFGAKGGGTSTCTYDLISAIHNVAPGECVDLLTPSVSDPTDRIMGSGEPWIKVVDNDYRTPLALSHNLCRFLSNSDYDVYHTNGMWMHINHSTCVEARRKNKPYVITPHGMLYPETLARSSWKKWPMRKIWFDKDIREASCIHVTCVDEMNHLRRFGYSGPIALIGNPVSVPNYSKVMIENREYKNEDSVNIGFLGRIHPRKHIERIIYGLCLSHRSNISLYVMGKGDETYEYFIHSEAKRLGVADRVHFLGFKRGKEKFEQLSKIDALFVPSDMENFGMIIPEALIVGTPVMASLGTPWEALNKEKCGWWCDNSPETIAEVIDGIYNLSAQELAVMGIRGREYVLRKFAADKVASQMLSLYKWLTHEAAKPDFIYN